MKNRSLRCVTASEKSDIFEIIETASGVETEEALLDTLAGFTPNVTMPPAFYDYFIVER